MLLVSGGLKKNLECFWIGVHREYLTDQYRELSNGNHKLDLFMANTIIIVTDTYTLVSVKAVVSWACIICCLSPSQGSNLNVSLI